MFFRSGCLAADKPWQLAYAIAVLALTVFGGHTFGLGAGRESLRVQSIFFALLFGLILWPLFEIWWRDCKPTSI